MIRSTDIRSGECLSELFGIAWPAVYYADYNAEFRERNPDPNRIAVGSVIHFELDMPYPHTPAALATRFLLPTNTHEGVEVGVFKGNSSAAMLKWFPHLHLHMVDPWAHYSELLGEKQFERRSTATAEGWAECLESAKRATKSAESRRTILRMSSATAAPLFVDGSLNFVFIDGNHSYVSVKEDIHLWRPKVARGGFLIGHDYWMPTVKQGVDELLSAERGPNNTWFVQL
jgi:hypothetical protein